MGDLLHRYEDGFRQVQPGVSFEESLFSTITAVAGVYTGRAEIGLLGREIWPTEIESFQSVLRRPPVLVDVATGSLDVPKPTFALMLFVSKANPIRRLSVGQLERIFSSAPGVQPLRTWGQLGLEGSWSRSPIHLYGFAPENDKSRIFGNLIFRKGESWNPELQSFSNETGDHATDAGQLIVNAVAADPDGLGISNIHYAMPGVRAVPIAASEDGVAVSATKDTVHTRTYPLTRAVYMVTDQASGQQMNPLVMEFLRFVLSRQGQQAVLNEGNYLPLPADVAEAEARKLLRGNVLVAPW